MKSIKQDLRGNHYTIVFRELFLNDGICDHPNDPHPRIIIDRDLTHKELLDKVLHECLHACFWDLDETCIKSAATDIANLLYLLGFRQVPESLRRVLDGKKW